MARDVRANGLDEAAAEEQEQTAAQVSAAVAEAASGTVPATALEEAALEAAAIARGGDARSMKSVKSAQSIKSAREKAALQRGTEGALLAVRAGRNGSLSGRSARSARSRVEGSDYERYHRVQQRYSQGSYSVSRDRSAASSLYGVGRASSLLSGVGGASSLMSGAGGSLATTGATLSIGNGHMGGGGGMPSGTLSPPYTLVNSDGASLRVHTGSIRERYMQQQVSAIHEDSNSDLYSDSLLTYEVQSITSPYQHYGPQPPPMAAGSYNYRAVGGDEMGSDEMSMMSGLSEGGASTTRVRMATDRAYNALRCGPQAAASLFSYYSGTNNDDGLHRVTSFAASSDPGGLASAGSFYDTYYYDPEGHSTCHARARFSNGGDVSDIGAGREDLSSLVRSDVAVYGGGEDVKFPFPPDNMSEFSGPLSPLDADRISRDYSEHMYHASPSHYRARSPQFFEPYGGSSSRAGEPSSSLPPPQQQQQQSERAAGKKAKKTKKKKEKDAHLVPRYPRNKTRSSTAGADYAGPSTSAAVAAVPSTSPRSGVRQWMAPSATAPSATAHPWRHAARRYRHRSAGESTIPSPTVARAVTLDAAGSPPPPPPPMVPLPLHPANDNAHAEAIRPNAIMRFLKRIAPRN